MKTKTEIENLLTKFQSNWNWKQIDQAQGSDDWFRIKLGIISSSNAHKVVAKEGTATRNNYLMELCAQVATRDHAKLDANALAWGRSFEEPARATFAFTYGKEIEEVPFVFKDDNWREGSSPDGLIYEDNLGAEIKCPQNSLYHATALLENKCRSEIMWQIQHQIRILEADKWIWASFDPRFTKTPLHIVEIPRDDKKQKTFDTAVPIFLEQFDEMLDRLGLKWGEQWEE